MTPISPKLVQGREREELVVRFFAYLEKLEVREGRIDILGWHDRPREFIWDFVSEANDISNKNLHYIAELEMEFERMLEAVDTLFEFGFRKSAQAKQVPRVRFEAISVGTALALRQNPDLLTPPICNTDWSQGQEFADVTTSDAANVKSKLIRRISFVFERLCG